MQREALPQAGGTAAVEAARGARVAHGREYFGTEGKHIPMGKASFYHVTTAGTIVAAAGWREAIAAGKKNGYAWLDYSDPTAAELSELVEPLRIHPLSIEDCIDSNQIPKIEDYPSNTFMLFNDFHFSEHALAIHEVDVIIGAHYLVTVHRGQAGDTFLSGVERLAGLERESIRQGPAFLLHVLLDLVVDRKFVETERMEDELGEMEDKLLADPDRFEPSGLLHLRRDLLTARKSLFYEREILVRVCRRDCPFVGERAIYMYRDIYDHLARLFELTEASRDMVTSLMEMHLSMLNNQMAKSANETNSTVRRLTFITTIFMPLTLLAGIGGMSEWSMMTGPSNWRISYPLFILAMVIIAIANYFLLRRFDRKTRGTA